MGGGEKEGKVSGQRPVFIPVNNYDHQFDHYACSKIIYTKKERNGKGERERWRVGRWTYRVKGNVGRSKKSEEENN